MASFVTIPPSGADRSTPSEPVGPGLVRVAALGAVALAISHVVEPLSALVVAVILGALWSNTIGVGDRSLAGSRLAARVLLRAGIVALGFRLALADMAGLGISGIAIVAATVTATFFGTQWLGRRMGLDRDLSLLVATGYSICGASAIAAMEPATDADEDRVAAAVGLVTLFGSLAIVVLPALRGSFGLDADAFGTWVGASTHDVAQVVAAASTGGSVALSAAVVVKLTRVALLAPLVAGVNLSRRRVVPTDDRPPLLPRFVVGFLLAVALRSTGALPDAVLDAARFAEQALLTLAMVGLGTGVRVAGLRSLGWRPLLLGGLAWVVVGGVSLGAIALG